MTAQTKVPYRQLRPQQRQIINHCRKQGHITVDSAITYYRIMSLSRRINDLEEAGYSVDRENARHPVTGQRYTRYFVEA